MLTYRSVPRRSLTKMIAMQAEITSGSLFRETMEEILRALGRREIDTTALLASKAKFLTNSLSLAAPLPMSGEPYSRKIIYNGVLGEVMVAHWPAGAECRPHDHGGANGLVTVLMGAFLEQPFRGGRNFAAYGPQQSFAVGNIETVIPTEIHSLRAVTEGVTLHLYSPAIRGMKVYDEEQRIIYTVANDCGAWIPSDESLILHREPFGADPLHD